MLRFSSKYVCQISLLSYDENLQFLFENISNGMVEFQCYVFFWSSCLFAKIDLCRMVKTAHWKNIDDPSSKHRIREQNHFIDGGVKRAMSNQHKNNYSNNDMQIWKFCTYTICHLHIHSYTKLTLIFQCEYSSFLLTHS